MNLTKDAYLEIARTADDRTIVKMLSVNKKFRDEKFFKLVFHEKYPLLVKFKKENETWKDFYLRMVMYIAKLKEDFDLDYIPSPKFNPEEFYTYAKSHKRDWQLDAAEYLHEVQDIEFVKKFLLKYAKYIDFDYLIFKEIDNPTNVKLLVDADIKANARKKFYSPVYSASIINAINNENIELLKILILHNIRNHNLENFIEYAREHNKPLSEKYLLSLVK